MHSDTGYAVERLSTYFGSRLDHSRWRRRSLLDSSRDNPFPDAKPQRYFCRPDLKQSEQYEASPGGDLGGEDNVNIPAVLRFASFS